MPKPNLAVVRQDDFKSAIGLLGDSREDKLEAAYFAYTEMPVEHLEELWAQDDISARIVETLPETMLREGYDILVQPSEEESEEASQDAKAISEAVGAWLDEMEVDPIIEHACNAERALGGAAIVLGVEDGQADPALPLNENALRSLDSLTVLTRDELKPLAYYDDPREPRFGKVRLYGVKRQPEAGRLIQVVPTRAAGFLDPETEVVIHESRLIRLGGIRLPRRLASQRHGWGGSIIERCYYRVRDFGMSWKAAAHLISDFSQAVLGIKGLATRVLAGDNSVIKNRAEQLRLSRSVARMLVLDADETFERKATPMNGLPEVLQLMAQRVAAAARMPVTVLMGMSPAGLNATGESDIRLFYDGAKVQQHRKLRPILNRIVQLLFRAKQGPTNGREPDNWTVRFRPLWQMSDEERAKVRFTMAQADQLYVQFGILAPEEVAESRFRGDEYSLDTVLDTQTRDALETGGDVEAPAPAPTGAAADPAQLDPEAVDPRTALNGAQVASMVEIIRLVATGELPRETGVELLTAAFPLSREQADKIMGPVGRTFTVDKPPPPSAAPGGQPHAPPKTNVQNISLNSEGSEG